MKNNFYKYISKNGNSYYITKNNENFGSYTRLSDALYERDRLIQADWNWDALMELPETENFYEKMNLPKFIHEYSYICRIAHTYKVYKNGEYYCSFNGKRNAHDYAKMIGGEVVEENHMYRVQKSVDGKIKHFGSYKTMEEAVNRRDELVKKGWKE